MLIGRSFTTLKSSVIDGSVTGSRTTVGWECSKSLYQSDRVRLLQRYELRRCVDSLFMCMTDQVCSVCFKIPPNLRTAVEPSGQAIVLRARCVHEPPDPLSVIYINFVVQKEGKSGRFWSQKGKYF